MTRIAVPRPEDLIARIEARQAKLTQAASALATGTMSLAKAKTALVGLLEDSADQWQVIKKIIARLN